MLGRSLGNYDIVSQIGEGGMGVVYLARHAMLGRAVAIKVLRSARPDPDTVSRFFNEARAATAVRHPGIVEVYDVGFLEDRTAFIVMEYLEGESLAARIRRGRSAIDTTLATIRAIARALQAVHDHGIVHRDLKPDNVFLVPDLEIAGRERVKILDFGIAKLTERLGSFDQTMAGTLLGTPIYMSPEQCLGERSIDHRSDLYSLGCVAYEMLCGQPPFTGDAPGDLIARHQYVEPAPLRWHRPDVPADIERLVMRLLEKRPDDRYPTAADVVRAIDQLGLASAVVAAGDLLPTLSTTLGATPTAATVSGAAPVAPRGRRVGILAGAATAAIALLVVLFVLADAVPGAAAEPSGLDDPVLESLRRAAYKLRWGASLQAEAWVEHHLNALLDARGGRAIAKLLRLIARAHAVQDDVTAPLETAVTCLAVRRRSLHGASIGSAAFRAAPAAPWTRDRLALHTTSLDRVRSGRRAGTRGRLVILLARLHSPAAPIGGLSATVAGVTGVEMTIEQARRWYAEEIRAVAHRQRALKPRSC